MTSRIQSQFSILESCHEGYVSRPLVMENDHKIGGARVDLLGWLQGKSRQSSNQAQADMNEIGAKSLHRAQQGIFLKTF